MGDTDLSFEALKRFEEVDTRLSALEEVAGLGQPQIGEEVVTEEVTLAEEPLMEEEEEPATTSSKGRRRST